MKPRALVLILFAAALMGAGVVYVVMRGTSAAQATSSARDDDERLERLSARLESMEAALRARAPSPRASRAEPPKADAPATSPADREADRAATVAEVEKFLAERLKEDEAPVPQRHIDLGVGDAGTRSLKEAAKTLALKPEQVQRVQDAFRKEGEDQLKVVFGTDDIEAIRARIREAETDPDARTKLQDDLLANLLRSLPKIRRAEVEKVKTLKETLGPEGYERFHRLSVREGDSDEFDALLEKTFAE